METVLTLRTLKKWTVLLAMCCPAWSARAQVPVVEEGRAPARIYLAESDREATPALHEAVEDFRSHLEKMTGRKLEIVRAGGKDEVATPAIVVGTLAKAFDVAPAPTRYGDAIRVLTRDHFCFLTGENDEAVGHALYTLLERLGCEWVMPGGIGEVIPKRSSLVIPKLDLEEAPGFPERKMWYTGGKSINSPEDFEAFEVWKRRQRLGVSDRYPSLGIGHVWGDFIRRHSAEFEKDPTMYALVRQPDGSLVRRGPQLEATHPRVVELFVEEIRTTFAKNGWPKEKVVGFGIGPADGLSFSVSPEAADKGAGRIDPLSGYPDQTDLLILLGNEILSRIEKEYPGVSLGFYAYSVHGDYPARYKPHPRINQIFAPINYSRYHSIKDENSKTWPYYRGVVEQWSRLSREQGNLLSYRGYNWNLAENMSPYSKLRIYGDEIPWYHEHGFTSVNMEVVKAWAITGPSDFLLAKLLWNPKADWREVLTHYCQKAYGKGAEAMEAYWLNLTRRQHEAGEEAGSYHALHLLFSPAFIAQQTALIRDAMARAQTPEEKTRAAYALKPLEELTLFLQMQEAANRVDFTAAQTGYDALLAHWEEAHRENSALVSAYVPRFLKRFWASYVENGVRYSTPPYRIEEAFPEALPTLLDPNSVGEQLGFQNPSLQDARYLKTHTWSIPWDSQGLGAYRNGAVWYRHAFERTAQQAGQPLGLFLGGVDDQALVWVNGKAIGASRVGFSRPFVFDLSGHLREGRNLLAIKIVRFHANNELGTGGLFRPAFLFTGNAIEPIPEDGQPARRVLPGGALGEVEPAPAPPSTPR